MHTFTMPLLGVEPTPATPNVTIGDEGDTHPP